MTAVMPIPPATLPVRPDTIPPELRDGTQFVAWQWENREGKWTKPPRNARTGGMASSTDPATWTDFPTAYAYASRHYAGRGGVGRVLVPGGTVWGIDLDHCRDPDTGELAAWAWEIIRALDSYAEVSPSGTGVRIFLKAALPLRSGKRGDVEMYREGRYLTLTGHHLAGTPPQVQERAEAFAAFHGRVFADAGATGDTEKRIVPVSVPVDAVPDNELIARALRARNGDKFAGLWAGSTAGYGSQSEADIALCSLIAFYTGPDEARIDGLFRRSGLMREKWDLQRGDATYGERTIREAVASRTEYYTPGGRHTEHAVEHAVEHAADAPPAPEAATGKGRGPSQASQLAALAADADLFHDAAGETYATIAVSNHRETHPTKSKAFRLWLARRYYAEQGGVPGNQAIGDAQAAIAGDALFAGEERPVHVRLAEHGERIYIDLCDPQWRVVEIDAGGWRVLAAADCPVRFRRTKGMKPLPEPTRGGSVADLRPFVNVATDADFVLMVAWLVAALRPHGPYPLLTIHGEQGSGKTNTARVLRDLVDPHEAPVRSLPRDERDLMISATNNWLPVFDNVSGIPVWLSDALCRIATGGGFATRELYADADETILNAQRPVILTGIEDVANRSDLLDRSIITTLPRIPDHARKTEAAFNLSFAIARPAIFGALCSAVAGALANVAAVQFSRLPRMADFAVWATAAETACGFAAGAFMDAYVAAREDANATAIEASAIGAAVLAFAKSHSGQWCGTAGELLAELHRHADDKTRAGKEWPADGTRLSGKLRRIAPNLRAVGVALDLSGKRTAGKRTVTLEWVGETASSASRASHEDAEGSGGKENGGDATHDAVKMPASLLPLAASSRDADDATRDATDLAASSHEGRQGKGNDADDADDAVSRLYPEPFSDALDWHMLTHWCAQVRDGTTDILSPYMRTVATRCGIPPGADEPPHAFAERLAAWLHAHQEAA